MLLALCPATAFGQIDDLTEEAGMTRLLNEVAWQNLEHVRLLNRAKRDLQDGRVEAGLERIQYLFDLSRDSFIPSNDSGRMISLWRAARRLLETQSDDVLDRYERRFGRSARMRFDERLRAGRMDRVHEIVRRFYCTEAGFDAAQLIARRLVDSARFLEAADVWSDLVSSPAHSDHISRDTVFRLAFALRRAGESVEQRLERLNLRQSIVDSTLARLADLPPGQTRPVKRASTSDDWLMSQGGPDRRRNDDASTPWLSPVWSHRFVGEQGSSTAWLVEQWRQKDRLNETITPPAVSNTPIAVGNLLIARDFGFVNAFEVSTGRPVWRYQCETSLAHVAAASARAKYTSARRRIPNKWDVYAGNSTAGLLSSDGRRVYVIDTVDFTTSSGTSYMNPGLPKRGFNPFLNSGRQGTSRFGPSTLNRLIALPVAPGHGPTVPATPLWTAGGPAEPPEWFVEKDVNSDGTLTQEEFGGTENAFRQLDLDDDLVIDPGEAVASQSKQKAGLTLDGHSFLGPPLPVHGRLYAVTATDGQLNVIAMDAETARPIWIQPIGVLWGSLKDDPTRSRLACSLAWHDGILICPTHLKTLVALSTVDGSLLWTTALGESTSPDIRYRIPVRQLQAVGHTGFATAPQITADNKVFYLGTDSRFLYCLELESGRVVWRVDRRGATGAGSGGDEYIGAVTDDMLLVVGRESCRGLDRTTGQQRWIRQTGLPAGRGLHVRDKYLLPLDSGRIAGIEIATGREIGFSFASPHLESESDAADVRLPAGWLPGNLIVADDYIVSAGAERVDVFRQVDDMLDETRERLARTPDSTEARLLYAQLQLSSGDIVSAADVLRESLAAERNDVSRVALESLMREILYLQLEQSSADPTAVLAELDTITRTKTERSRYLLRRANLELDRGRFDELMLTVNALRPLNVDAMTPVAGNSAHRVSTDSLLADLFERVARDADDFARSRFELEIAKEHDAALLSGDPDRMEQFVRHYPWFVGAAQVRQELAEHLASRGDWHRAEMHLILNTRSDDRAVAARATAALARLYSQAGLFLPAASMVRHADKRFRGVRLDENQTWDRFRRRFADSVMLKHAERLGTPPSFHVTQVEISESPWVIQDLTLNNAFRGYRTSFSLPPGSSHALFSHDVNDEVHIAVVDRQSGTLHGRVKFTGTPQLPPPSRGAHVGHFFPAVTGRTIRGVSLLKPAEQPQVWHHEHGAVRATREIIRLGPAGPTFCSLQTRNSLIVSDPGTGRTLWSRRDIPIAAGLVNDPYAGLFGDDEAVVLLDANRSGYSVYRTATGKLIRRGRLDLGQRPARKKFGRRLFHVTGQNPSEFRIWDPLTDRTEFSVPVLDEMSKRQSSYKLDDRHVAAVVDPGRLMVIDVPSAKVVADVPVEGLTWREIQKVEGYSDHENFYINLTRRTTTRGRLAQRKAGVVFRSLDNGFLHVVDRSTGRLKWMRELPPKSIVQTPWFELPFLVTLTWYMERTGNQQQTLSVRVYDRQTGHTIGRRDNLFAVDSNQFVHVEYQPDRYTVILRGLQNQLELRFPPALQLAGR